jgi:demethylmenaquinone methyltransferase / 2-methoxy-6-polyprenyl-1,4-benzoquinol methylase
MNKELDFVKEMFDKIAHRYDFLNRLLSFRQDVMWRSQMVQGRRPRSRGAGSLMWPAAPVMWPWLSAAPEG